MKTTWRICVISAWSSTRKSSIAYTVNRSISTLPMMANNGSCVTSAKDGSTQNVLTSWLTELIPVLVASSAERFNKLLTRLEDLPTELPLTTKYQREGRLNNACLTTLDFTGSCLLLSWLKMSRSWSSSWDEKSYDLNSDYWLSISVKISWSFFLSFSPCLALYDIMLSACFGQIFSRSHRTGRSFREDHKLPYQTGHHLPVYDYPFFHAF